MSSKEELQAQIEAMRRRQQQLLVNYNTVLNDDTNVNRTNTNTNIYVPNTPPPQMPQYYIPPQHNIPPQYNIPPPQPPSKDARGFSIRGIFGKDKKAKDPAIPVYDMKVAMNVTPAFHPTASPAWTPSLYDLKSNTMNMDPSLPPSYNTNTTNAYAPLHDLKPDTLNVTPHATSSLPPPYDSRKAQKQHFQAELTRAAKSGALKKKFDLIFLVDCTGSMTNLIGAVVLKLNDILKLVEQSFPDVTFEVAFVGYRDINYGNYIIHGFTEADILRQQLLNVSVIRNCDEAEDVLGGYEQVLKLLNGRTLRNRCLIHFFDAPPHGKRFHDEQTEAYDRFWNYEPSYPHKPSTWLEECVATLCSEKVYCSMIALLNGYNEAPLDKTVKEFRTAFNRVPNRRGEKMFNAHTLDFWKVDATKDANLSDFVEIVRKALEDSLSSAGVRPKTPAASI